MLKAITEVGHSRVVDLTNSCSLGQIVNWVINPDHKQISAFLVKPIGLWQRTKAIATIDIVEYGPKLVVVKSDDALVPPSEIVHLAKPQRHHNKVLGNPVVTKSGKRLGAVSELLFETTDSTLQKLYIQPGVLGLVNQPDLIIGADRIIQITPKEIIVHDDNYVRETISKIAPVTS